MTPSRRTQRRRNRGRPIAGTDHRATPPPTAQPRRAPRATSDRCADLGAAANTARIQRAAADRTVPGAWQPCRPSRSATCRCRCGPTPAARTRDATTTPSTPERPVGQESGPWRRPHRQGPQCQSPSVRRNQPGDARPGEHESSRPGLRQGELALSGRSARRPDCQQGGARSALKKPATRGVVQCGPSRTRRRRGRHQIQEDCTEATRRRRSELFSAVLPPTASRGRTGDRTGRGTPGSCCVASARR